MGSWDVRPINRRTLYIFQMYQLHAFEWEKRKVRCTTSRIHTSIVWLPQIAIYYYNTHTAYVLSQWNIWCQCSIGAAGIQIHFNEFNLRIQMPMHTVEKCTDKFPGHIKSDRLVSLLPSRSLNDSRRHSIESTIFGHMWWLESNTIQRMNSLFLRFFVLFFHSFEFNSSDCDWILCFLFLMWVPALI